MSSVRFIGDVHCKYGDYVALARSAPQTLQLGDLGFQYDCLDGLDPTRHRVLAGNHDNYDQMNAPHWLGDWGVADLGGLLTFFVRGGRSIDRSTRTAGVDWWPQEELTYLEMERAIECYRDIQPHLVVSHECPAHIVEPLFGTKVWDGEVLRPSMTAQMLRVMHQSHRPRTWIFGHHHKSRNVTIDGTNFRCLAELEAFDLCA